MTNRYTGRSTMDRSIEFMKLDLHMYIVVFSFFFFKKL